MSEPDNLILAHLRELRAAMDARFKALDSQMEARFDGVEKRFDLIERRLDMMHRNGEKALRGFIGHRAMVERTMASFEDEISTLKRRVELLETAQS